MTLGNFKRSGALALSAVVLTASTALFGSGAATAAPSASSHGQSPVVAHTDAGRLVAPITGMSEDGRKVRGTFTPSSFSVVNDTLMVTGTVAGRFLGKGAPESFSQEITTQVKNASVAGAPSGGRMAGAALGSCDILHLDLGPLNLDLLGLQVHLNQVVLDIVAQSGAGNLLGNLLCTVAGLLDGNPLGGLLGTVLTQISTLLNQILGALQL